jgi:hypothetical protein
MKESGGGDEYKYDIFDTFTCVNATMYPTQHNNKGNKRETSRNLKSGFYACLHTSKE